MQNDLIHDGTGQNARMLAALDPQFFQLDERSRVEMLKYARELSKMIQYFDSKGKNAGDWQKFLSNTEGGISDQEIQEILKYQNDPTVFAKDLNRLRWLSRPHFVLFQTFLTLLERVKQDMNRFSGRHLDYYYRDILGFKPRKPEADLVYLLAELTNETANYFLPKGTLLKADKDAEGNNRSFQTEEDILFNNAQIAEIRTAVVDRSRLSIAEYYEKIAAIGTEDPFLKLLGLVYGNVKEDFPPFAGLPVNPTTTTNMSWAKVFIKYTKWLFDSLTDTKTAKAGFCLSLSEIRKFFKLRDTVTRDDADWMTINGLMVDAKKSKFPNWVSQNPQRNIRDFIGLFQEVYTFDPLNLQKSDTNPFKKDFQGVEDIFDLTEQLEEQLKWRTDKNPLFDNVKLNKFRTFIQDTLLMPLKESDLDKLETFSETKFGKMMSLLRGIRSNWSKINRLIKKAGAVKTATDFNPDWVDLPFFPSLPDVESRLRAALNLGSSAVLFNLTFSFTFTEGGAVTTVNFNSLDQIQGRLNELDLIVTEIRDEVSKNVTDLNLRSWFYLPYEEVQLMLGKVTYDEPNYKITDKPLVFKLLEKAAYKKQFLNNQKENTKATANQKDLIPFNPVVPYKDVFNGFFAQTDAKKNRIEHGKTSAWRTFGTTENASEVGLAIQSDLLLLSEGSRQIMLELNLVDREDKKFVLPQGGQSLQLFDYWVSTEKGWFLIDKPTVLATAQEVSSITLTVAKEAPSIVPPPEGLFFGDPSVPVLKMTLKKSVAKDGETTVHPFLLLKGVRVKSIKLTISGDGLIPIVAENDNGTINPKKPFQPFGSTPTVGSSFFFGHRELFKPLTSISLAYTWKGIIGDTLNNHYLNYDFISKEPKFFDKADSAQLSAWHKNIQETGPLSMALFNMANPPSSVSVATMNQTDLSMTDEVFDWSRYFRLQLNLDLQHNNYVGLAGQKAMQFSMDLQDALAKRLKEGATPATPLPNAASYKLNAPYTPEWSAFKIKYTASAILFDDNNNTGSVLHLYPFGYLTIPIQKDVLGKKFASLLPEFTDSGSLFIGLSNCKPPQQISLLFQLAEGSANPDLDKAEVTWTYLNTEGWQSFNGSDILMEQTAGLSNSGIIKLAIPSDATDSSTLMPKGVHWIKASVQNNRESACDIIQIHTQAVTAVRVLEPDSMDDPGKALPADTITGFYERQSGIKTISQPYISFGGKSAESENSFLPRISERLRHRERALTCWDVERLVLAHFPDVYKAKCLPTKDNSGEITVVLVPDIRDKALYDAFKPKMPVNRLRAIGHFLEQHSAIAASFRATNPVYVELKVKAAIQFRIGVDALYHLALLEEELKRFLAPWAYQEGADITIDSTVYPSVVVNFIEEKPYVDYVVDLKLFKSEEGSASIDTTIGTLQANRPESVWVSAQKHDLTIAPQGTDQVTLAYQGIGYMQVDYDFFIA